MKNDSATGSWFWPRQCTSKVLQVCNTRAFTGTSSWGPRAFGRTGVGPHSS